MSENFYDSDTWQKTRRLKPLNLNEFKIRHTFCINRWTIVELAGADVPNPFTGGAFKSAIIFE